MRYDIYTDIIPYMIYKVRYHLILYNNFNCNLNDFKVMKYPASLSTKEPKEYYTFNTYVTYVKCITC